MSEIIDFYRGKKPPSCNHFMSEVWSYSFTQLEDSHDYIQWIFPLDEPSNFNPYAPVLTKEDIDEFKSDPLLLWRLLASVNMYMKFLSHQANIWVGEYDHNHLRITRMLKCLVIMGLHAEAVARLENIMLIIKAFKKFNPPGPDLSESIKFWYEAVYIYRIAK